jgi:hypothetical protein
MILEGGSNKRFVLNDGRHVEFKSNPRAFSGAVLTFEDITERINAEKQMINMARYDALTGLPNRSYFATLISERLKQMNNDGIACSSCSTSTTSSMSTTRSAIRRAMPCCARWQTG